MPVTIGGSLGVSTRSPAVEKVGSCGCDEPTRLPRRAARRTGQPRTGNSTSVDVTGAGRPASGVVSGRAADVPLKPAMQISAASRILAVLRISRFVLLAGTREYRTRRSIE
jgi:hypothetical protein